MDLSLFLDISKTLFGALGILGNGLVCVVIAKVPAMRTQTNAIIFNQAIIDFISCVLVIMKSYLGTPGSDNEFLFTIHCHLLFSGAFIWIFFVASTLNLVLLTLERYVAIMYPFKYVVYFGKRQVAVMLVAVWMIATGFELRLVSHVQVINGDCGYPNKTRTVFITDGTITFLFEYLIPLIIMTSCYVHIAGHLKKTASNVHPGQPNNQDVNSMSGSLIRARRNTLKTLFIVFVTYIICWTPNQTIYLIYHFGMPLDFQGVLYVSTEFLVQLNTCVNPVIYAFKYKQFQKGVRSLLKPCCPRLAVRSGENTVSSIATNVA
ncbi:neuromedin-U receptor 2-like [Asterias rubens]|uniref:neuromedin-U receptor 2-like n=1 Tax=Asterias rubens TaxID=7604 RepID=UPI001455BA31|nr:neuromedin-U receptor 2-like [Asterias rubens]